MHPRPDAFVFVVSKAGEYRWFWLHDPLHESYCDDTGVSWGFFQCRAWWLICYSQVLQKCVHEIEWLSVAHTIMHRAKGQGNRENCEKDEAHHCYHICSTSMRSLGIILLSWAFHNVLCVLCLVLYEMWLSLTCVASSALTGKILSSITEAGFEISALQMVSAQTI